MDKIIEKLFDVYMETEDFPLGRQEKKQWTENGSFLICYMIS